MNWLLPLFTSVILLSAAVLLQRAIISGKKVDSVAYSVMFQLLVAVALTPIVFAQGFRFERFSDYALLMTIASIGFGVGTVVYAKTLKYVEASAFAVLFSTANIWVALYGIIFLHETVGLYQILGTILVFTSVILLVKDPRSFKLEKGIALGLLTGAIYGVAVTSTSLVTKGVDVFTWTWLSFITGAFASLLVSPKSLGRARPLFRGTMPIKLLALGVLYGLGSLAMMIAYRDGPLSLISPLRQSSVLVTTILAFAVFRSERTDITKKLAAALICAVGAALIVI